jgi:hypothetical protein
VAVAPTLTYTCTTNSVENLNIKSSKNYFFKNYSKIFHIDHKVGAGVIGAGANEAGPIDTLLHHVMALATPK